MRSGKWKLHLPRPAQPPWTPKWAHHIPEADSFEITKPLLYDLESDIGEKTDLAAGHPEEVSRLMGLADRARNDIGDYDTIGANARFPDPQPPRPDIGTWETE